MKDPTYHPLQAHEIMCAFRDLMRKYVRENEPEELDQFMYTTLHTVGTIMAGLCLPGFWDEEGFTLASDDMAQWRAWRARLLRHLASACLAIDHQVLRMASGELTLDRMAEQVGLTVPELESMVAAGGWEQVKERLDEVIRKSPHLLRNCGVASGERVCHSTIGHPGPHVDHHGATFTDEEATGVTDGKGVFIDPTVAQG